MEWLRSIKKECVRINNLIDNDSVIELHINNKKESNSFYPKILVESINRSSIWLRKGEYYNEANKDISEYYRKENGGLINFLFAIERNKKVIGKPFNAINKLEILSKAKYYDIDIPNTILTNSKIKLLKFIKQNKIVISKAISEVLILSNNQKGTYTTILKARTIDSLPERFHTSLFQQYIEKEFDIRVFYLDGKIYPMTIFSQKDKKTKVDFRKYNYIKPNRTVRYKLPQNIEERLIKFMSEENMEAASIDIVKCKNSGKYYFLEVNPWGQFGMVSKPCNYYLEQAIAEML